MGLPRSRGDYGTMEELANAHNHIAVCHRQAYRRAIGLGWWTGKE